MTEPNSDTKQPQQNQEERLQRYRQVGEQLRLRRESLGLQQPDVARDLHLPGVVVNDLETGRIDHLSSLYRRGYIRNYANLLDLDAERLLFEAGEEQPPELQEVLPAAKPGFQLDRYLKFATYAIVTVAIVPPLIYFFIAGGSRMLDGDGSVEESAVASASLDVEEGGAEEATSGSEPQSRPARHVSASALPLSPVRPAAERTAEPASEGPSDTEVTGALDPALPTVNLTALDLELLDDSWVEITDAEGDRLEYDLLRAGQKRQYEGQAPFRLLIGRSSAVSLAVDGQAVSWEGDDSGDVAELSISADGEILR